MAISSRNTSAEEMAGLAAFLSAAGFNAPFQIEPIVQEASHRSYFRILFESGKPESLVLCKDLPIPDPESHDSLRINRYLRSCEISVPEILFLDKGSGWILQSDAGRADVSDTLRSAGFEAGTDQRRILLESVLSLLSKLHAVPPSPPVEHRFFDREKLWWEMEFLLSRCKEIFNHPEYRGRTISIQEDFIAYLERLVWKLSQAKPMVYTHRDFHGRNILVRNTSTGNQLTLVDYQDARMGLPWYDLASFLYDPYSSVQPEERSDLFRQYCAMNAYDPEESYSMFRMQAIQRLLKALGSFIYFVYQKQMEKYIPSIPRALDLLLSLSGTDEQDAPLVNFLHDVQKMIHDVHVESVRDAT